MKIGSNFSKFLVFCLSISCFFYEPVICPETRIIYKKNKKDVEKNKASKNKKLKLIGGGVFLGLVIFSGLMIWRSSKNKKASSKPYLPRRKPLMIMGIPNNNAGENKEPIYDFSDPEIVTFEKKHRISQPNKDGNQEAIVDELVDGIVQDLDNLGCPVQ